MHGEKNYPFQKTRSDLDVDLLDGTEDQQYLDILNEKLNMIFNKIKPELNENFVYIFPEPSEYGDVVNLSNTKRDNPFNFYFDKSSYKNISSSSSRKTVKANERNHYFHSYQSAENRRINITNNGTFPDSITDLINYGSVDKIETDIYGNEYIQIIPNKGVIKNTSDITVIGNAEFDSGGTIDITENKHGSSIEGLSGLSDKIYAYKEIYIKDAVTKTLLPLSASKFDIIYNKFKFNNKLYNEILENKITDINVYENTISIDLSSFSIIDTFDYNGSYIENASSPLIIEKDNTSISFITPDCYHNNSPYNNSFYFELFKYDTQKKIIEEVSTRNNETSSYFIESFTFDNQIKFRKIINSTLTYNSYDNSFLLTSTFTRENIFNSKDSLALHYFNFKIINNKIVQIKNILYTNYNDNSIPNDTETVITEAAGPTAINLLNGNKDITIPAIPFPSSDTSTSLTIAYSGNIDANFVLDQVVQNSGGLSLYKAKIDYGDGTTETHFSKHLPSGDLKLENFSVFPGSELKLLKGCLLYTLNIKSINSQKTNQDKFICNLVDKDHTIYNLIDTTTKSSSSPPFIPTPFPTILDYSRIISGTTISLTGRFTGGVGASIENWGDGSSDTIDHNVPVIHTYS